jgi:hypothetical protein
VSVLHFGSLSNALAERDLRRADIGIELVDPVQNIDLAVEIQFLMLFKMVGPDLGSVETRND